MSKSPIFIECTTAKSVMTPAALPDISARFALVRQSWLDSPADRMLVARADEQIVGLFLYQDYGKRLFAQIVAVDEAFRMNGIGAALADHLRGMARERGCTLGVSSAVSDGGRALIARKPR